MKNADPAPTTRRPARRRGAAPGERRNEHEIGLRCERGVELAKDVVDRQATGKDADQAGLRERGPLQMRNGRRPWQDGRKGVGQGGLNSRLGAPFHVLSGATAGVSNASGAVARQNRYCLQRHALTDI